MAQKNKSVKACNYRWIDDFDNSNDQNILNKTTVIDKKEQSSKCGLRLSNVNSKSELKKADEIAEHPKATSASIFEVNDFK